MKIQNFAPRNGCSTPSAVEAFIWMTMSAESRNKIIRTNDLAPHEVAETEMIEVMVESASPLGLQISMELPL